VVRRAIAAGIGVLILILLVLGVRGCLNAREERAYENYVSDLSSIAAESRNLSQQFFGRLQDPGDLTPLQFEAELQADRGAAEGLLDRAEGLDAPDDLAEAQDLIVLSYELRRDGLAVISDRIASALGDEGSAQAIEQIAREMRTFVASDVLHARSAAQIQAVLQEQEIVVPEGEEIGVQFLPAEPNWLDPDEVANALSGISGNGGAAAPGVHGLGLGTVTLLPTGAAIDEGVAVTATADGAELEVEVENQGESEETGVTVSYELTDGESSSGEEQIDTIAAGEIATVNLPIDPEPSAGTVELTVTAEPVPGEEIEDNNSVTASVTFE
jgi:CARDB